MAGRVQLLFRNIQRGYLKEMNLTTAQIQEMLKKYLLGLIQEYDKPAVPNWQTDEQDQHTWGSDQEAVDGSIQILDDMKAEYTAKIHSGDYVEAEPIAIQLLAEHGISESQVDKTSSVYHYLCSGILRAKKKDFEYQQARLSGKFSDDLEGGLDDCLPGATGVGKIPAPTVHSSPIKTSIALADLAEAYEREKSNWSISSKNEWKTIKKVYFRFVDPSTQAHLITRKVFYDYRDLLKCLPLRFISTKKYDHTTAEDVKALELSEDETVSASTINKHVTFLCGMFKHAMNVGDIPSNPASDMQVDEPKGKKQKVDKFSKADLELIFHSPVFGKSHPYQFWVPVLGLFTGARREELCNLYRDDIKQEDGVWYIDINRNRPDKQIKTDESERRIPLHPFVLELGFPAYVKEFKPGERLWPQLNNNNQSEKYGHYFGRWFNDMLIGPLGIKPTKEEVKAGALKKTFHSFRHSIITCGLRAGLDLLKLKDVVGHEDGGGTTTGPYNHGFPVKQIYDEIISQIDHGIDLEHLKDSKYVTK